MKRCALFAVLLTTNAALAQTPPPAASLLSDLFSASGAPTFLTKASEFVVSSQFRPGARRSQERCQGKMPDILHSATSANQTSLHSNH